ncbi:MAG: hypothetical protein CSA32_00180 [Desulfobulbus propionicus]|nr:MAG: hypothetical protein CSA32_00180 [Desulfobulbus propionicus]
MATGSQQFSNEYQQVKETLELYPKISLLKVEGQPPDSYEIEYAVKGYAKEANGTIITPQSHKVHISLPFGYPHFAPTVTPLTNIFHPDVDPAAVRIAEKWQQNPSLPDLIVYIGEMICGSIFSLEDPFNQEAADWFQRHKDELPLDSLGSVDGTSAQDIPSADVDTLVTETFSVLELDSDKQDNSFHMQPPPAAPSFEEEIKRIRNLVRQKQLNTASHHLAEFPDEAKNNEVLALENTVNDGLARCEQLSVLAEQLEEEGKPRQALEAVNDLMAIAHDIPGVNRLKERIKQAQSLVEFSETEVEKGGAAPASSIGNGKTSKTKKGQTNRTGQKSAATFRITIPGLPVKMLGIMLVAGVIVIGGISVYLKDQNALSRARTSLQLSKIMLEKKDVQEAKRALKEAAGYIQGLTVLSFRKSELEKEIDALENSPDIQMEQKGMELYQGKYVTAQKAAAMKELDTLVEQAEQMTDQSNYAGALALYIQAASLAQKNELPDAAAKIQEAEKKIKLEQVLQAANQAEEDKNWQKVEAAYQKALALANSLPETQLKKKINDKRVFSVFNKELNAAKKYFAEEQWQETIESLEKAQQLIEEAPDAVSSVGKRGLSQLLANAQLYHMLSTAKAAYNDREWDKAIQEYNNALALLKKESTSFGETQAESIRRIKKTVLMVKIAQIQKKVFQEEEKNNLTQAIDLSGEILLAIDSSPFSKDKDVVGITKKIQERLADQKKQLALDAKTDWLKEHYQELFRKHYPTFSTSKLLAPKVTLLKEEGQWTIFTMTCIEKGRGSSSRLELTYQHNSSTGKWSVYTD